MFASSVAEVDRDDVSSVVDIARNYINYLPGLFRPATGHFQFDKQLLSLKTSNQARSYNLCGSNYL
jgi:hypothetical protein